MTIEDKIEKLFNYKSYLTYFGGLNVANNFNRRYTNLYISINMIKRKVTASIIHNYNQYNLNLRRSNKQYGKRIR